MNKLNYYGTVEELQASIVGQVLPTQKVFAIVDAHTSKARIPLSLLEALAKVLQAVTSGKVRLAVTAGTRLDLLVAIMNKIQVVFPNLQQFTVQLTSGTVQKLKRRPSFVQFAVSSDFFETGGKMSNSINALGVRAKAGECTRLRCLSKECPLRPVDDIAKLNGVESGKPVDASREIDADDTEHMAIDDLMEEGDDEDELAEQQPQLVEPTKRDCIVDLWPFACAKEYYKHLIGGFSANETLSHLIILSTSAHPGPLFAAHDMRVMGHVYLDRVKTHCKKHGVQTLRDYLFRSYISEE